MRWRGHRLWPHLTSWRFGMFERNRIFVVAALCLWLCGRASPAQTTATQPTTQPVVHQFTSGEGKYQFTIDTSETPDLTEWADTKLAPVVKEWYPKLVEMLPSEGF